jgi:hypothetical protein
MPVEFRCPGCAGLLRVPDEHAGSAVRCPACRATPVAPRAEAPPMAEVVPDAAPEPVARPRAKPRALEPASAPRSSAKLIAGLIALIVALVGAGGFALWRTATAPAEWREFASPKGGYRVELPAAPRADIARRHRAPTSRADIARRHRAPTSRADTARRHRAPTSRADIARRHRAPTSRADIARRHRAPYRHAAGPEHGRGGHGVSRHRLRGDVDRFPRRAQRRGRRRDLVRRD